MSEPKVIVTIGQMLPDCYKKQVGEFLVELVKNLSDGVEKELVVCLKEVVSINKISSNINHTLLSEMSKTLSSLYGKPLTTDTVLIDTGTVVEQTMELVKERCVKCVFNVVNDKGVSFQTTVEGFSVCIDTTLSKFRDGLLEMVSETVDMFKGV